jgi:hypothetical protein
VIIEDFFDPYPSNAAVLPSSCRPALFACTDEQTEWVTKAGISRDVIFDGVLRSSTTAGYDTIIGVQEAKNNRKK